MLQAQQAQHYKQTNLISDIAGMGGNDGSEPGQSLGYLSQLL
jgi:hypothetical protein